MNNKLKEYFKNFKTAIVALSGGADSSAVLKLATDYLGKENVLAATCVNFNMFVYEINFAYKVADLLNVAWKPFYAKLANELFTDDRDKCFYCKKNILGELVKIKKEFGIDVIFDGSNIDDLADYRPGMKAIEMFNIKSPLLENELGKEYVSEVIKDSVLNTLSFHTQSCIATRVKTKNATVEDIRKIELAEDMLRDKFPDIRVRYFGDSLKVEFKRDRIVDEVDRRFIFEILEKNFDEKVKIII
ncbi:hypothetical protein [Deferribacter abyssi]|uniref:hypothetical protein n=1 Tax=Deferribacter abyssi TaxID=213806 RepID=UPI003C191249